MCAYTPCIILAGSSLAGIFGRGVVDIGKGNALEIYELKSRVFEVGVSVGNSQHFYISAHS